MSKHDWKDDALCLEYDTNLFFDKYEDDELLRPAVDKLCSMCPVSKMCFAVGVSQKEWGVWGGVHLEGGQISKEFSKHKSKSDFTNLWQTLTTEK